MKGSKKIFSKFDKWKIISRFKVQNPPADRQSSKIKSEDIIEILLENRGIKSKRDIEEFLNPKDPYTIDLEEFGIRKKSLETAIKRIVKAKKDKEKVIIFGDYDVDGICSSAILWEYLYGFGIDVIPYIPERFSEGYGIKIESIEKLKKTYPNLSLIITVDNGIVAFDAVSSAKNMGIDVIVIDHHEKEEKYPRAYSVIHTTKLCGSAISWVFVREINQRFKISNLKFKIDDQLALAALGTVADQIPLVSVNRSFVKYGLEKLNNTSRVGLNALYETAGIVKGKIGIYEINYVIAPRLNAMGRLKNAIESLRLLCTKKTSQAYELARLLNETNTKRQKIVDEVLLKVKKRIGKKPSGKIVVVSGKSYHEGVIGLAASRLVDEFFRPAVVISKGKNISKGSARSIMGFSIIGAIQNSKKLLIAGGGHEMAAGFSLKNKNLKLFEKRITAFAEKNIKNDILEKNLKVDLVLSFSDLTRDLLKFIQKMEPFGLGNPTPTFQVNGCRINFVKKIGKNGNHLKFNLEENGSLFDAVMFNGINSAEDFVSDSVIDIAFNFEENIWNGYSNLQLKIRDLK